MSTDLAPRPDVAIATFEDRLVVQTTAERSMFKTIAGVTVLALPICVVVWIGIVVLALRDSDQDLAVMIPMAAGIGLLAAGFFGCGIGSLLGAEALDDADKNFHRAQH